MLFASEGKPIERASFGKYEQVLLFALGGKPFRGFFWQV